MSRGTWKPKQPPPDSKQAGPMREISDLFMDRAALEHRLAENDGLLSAWFRTIGVVLGELPAAADPPQLGDENTDEDTEAA